MLRRAGALLVLSILLAGCGGGGAKNARREAVNAYITQVDATVASLIGERQQIDTALRNFSFTRPTTHEAARLQAVASEIRAVANKANALRPPREAARLHVKLLGLLNLQAAVATELASTTTFLPALSRALSAVKPASIALAQELGRAQSWQADAQAYAHYRDRLQATLKQLGRLDPPAELKPTVRAQIRELTTRARLADALSAGFARHDQAAVSARLRDFELASRSERERNYRAQLVLVKAYNNRLRQIASLATAIAYERKRLVAKLG
jgi:hypothetical protein